MYTNTRFGELLKALPKGIIDRCVAAHDSDRYYKNFNTRDHLVGLIYAQLSGCQGLRELEVAFNSHSAHHYHLNCTRLKRSTLSDANRNRPAAVYSDICKQLIGLLGDKTTGEASDLLYLLDSTPICLRGRGFEWVENRGIPRIPGLKLHVQYAPNESLPVDFEITESSVNDLEYGRQTVLEEGAKYVFDKAYCDYNWWREIDAAGACFVTRQKKNASIRLLGRRQVSGNILSDETIQLKNRYPGGGRRNTYRKALRRIVVHREDGNDPLILVTNMMDVAAEEVAELYKRRWAIELYFKWIKQRLKIKKFIGRNENAVRIQIYAALITYLLALLLRQVKGVKQDMYLWFAELKTTLFQRPELEYEIQKRRRRNRDLFRKMQFQMAI